MFPHMMTRIMLVIVQLLGLAMPAAAYESCAPVYRLYRTQVDLPGRVHVATFDSCEKIGLPRPGETYNSSNCEIARNLFQSQPGVVVTFWCELIATE
jgi:hypothetical protein